MIDTLIFDMDGLLIDSEPWWKLAEKKVFGSLGLELSDEMLRQVMGFRLSEVVAHWHRYQPWEHPDFARTEQEILHTVKDMIVSHAEPMPGVYDALAYAKQNGYKMSLASSSAMNLIEAVVDKLGIREYFSLLYSAETEPYGKPHPGIFMHVADVLSVSPHNCLVIEDSVNGMVAAKAARMHCLVVPEPACYEDPRFGLADYKLSSLVELERLLEGLRH